MKSSKIRERNKFELDDGSELILLQLHQNDRLQIQILETTETIGGELEIDYDQGRMYIQVNNGVVSLRT